jgi:tRNA pseudouridine38-40 synthase
MRIALGIEYDGSHFFGWQSQPNGQTVQDALNIALSAIAGAQINTHAAGRTDTGVHALMQVVHFDTETVRPNSAWVRGVNAHLPVTVRVLWAQPVSDNFHARFSASARSYQYWLINAPVAPAIFVHLAGWFHAPLNVAAMQTAANFLLGEHDFRAFRASECQAKTPVKTLQASSVTQQGNNIVFAFKANAFLQHQVRNMVGALVYVGKAKITAEDLKLMLNQQDRTLAPPTFSPNGLYLTGVNYPAEFGLPATQCQLDLPR